ncbi:MAG TPA: PQQ-binding-like beta-propeller repeat protein [Planctomycetota bacterium]|nr:PQQ-binding-like beta-propeller repeat protein [Planctomycetota bacterium]
MAALRTLLLLVLINISAFGGEGDWPQWRGPKRDGLSTETGLLKQWPAAGPPLAWRATGVGAGFSSVSVSGGKVFTMGDVQGNSCIIALDLSGKVLWTAKVGGVGGGGGYPGTRCTPAISGDVVIGMSQYGEIVCVHGKTGAEVWRKHMEKDFGGKMMSGWGYSESPLIDGELVILTPGGPKGTVLALKKTTGELVWRTADYKDAAAYSSVVPAEIGGVPQYLQLTGQSVAGIGAKDGKLLWRADRAGATAVISTPIYHEGLVYVTSGYGVGCNAFAVKAENGAFSTNQIYANKSMKNHHGGVIRVGDHVYGFNDSGGWTCMELKTGNVAWSDKGVGKGAIAYADGHLYMRGESGPGSIALVEATPAAYKEKGRFDPPDRSKAHSWAHPVIAGGKLYIRDQDVLLCYDVKAK